MADANGKPAQVGQVLKVSGPVVVGKYMSGASQSPPFAGPRPWLTCPAVPPQAPPCTSWSALGSRA